MFVITEAPLHPHGSMVLVMQRSWGPMKNNTFSEVSLSCSHLWPLRYSLSHSTRCPFTTNDLVSCFEHMKLRHQCVGPSLPKDTLEQTSWGL